MNNLLSSQKRLLRICVCHIQIHRIACHMMSPPLSYICVCFLECCCLYSFPGSSSHVIYCVELSPNYPVSLSIFLLLLYSVLSDLYYNAVYFNYLLLYLYIPLGYKVLSDGDSIFIFLLPEVCDWHHVRFTESMNGFSNNQQNPN